MTQTAHPLRLSDSDSRATRRLMEDARRAGVTQFQVLALIHPGTVDECVLLLDHRKDDVWTVPVAWVRPTETVASTLDWLCDRHVGLSSWEAAFATVATYAMPDGTEVLQLAFDVTVPPDGALAWEGACQWWRVDTDPPALHRLARPVVQQLRTAEPVGAPLS